MPDDENTDEMCHTTQGDEQRKKNENTFELKIASLPDKVINGNGN